LLVSCWSASPIVASDPLKVQFRLHAPGLPADAGIFITGNVPDLGNWHPAKVQMRYEGAQVWTHQMLVEQSRRIEYKYTQGSWDREGATAKGRPLSNFSLNVTKSVTQTDRIDHWTDKNRPPKTDGQITGRARYHRQMKGRGIRPRDIVVWLPPGYEASDKRYPVLYMHDGQNVFDPQTSAFGRDWQVDETCTRMITEGEIEPLIVVGIYNTADRSREYLSGDLGTAYRDFVTEDLKPLIDRTYRTKTDREHTFTAGSSAGGLCAFILTWKRDGVFSKAICMSPAFRYSREDGTMTVDYVTAVQESAPPKAPTFFYIDNGGVGLEALLQPGIDAMLDALGDKGWRPKQDYDWKAFPEDKHNEAAWAKRFPNALKQMLDAPLPRR
ncbi:MAG: alpha/beta hydrolase-fold protein, partial [Planctomycetota bacterium]